VRFEAGLFLFVFFFFPSKIAYGPVLLPGESFFRLYDRTSAFVGRQKGSSLFLRPQSSQHLQPVTFLTAFSCAFSPFS